MSINQQTLDRPIALSMRKDLVVVPHTRRGRPCWVVKDPMAQRYYELRDEEHSILMQLDGRISLRQLQRTYQETFAPRKVTPEQLQILLGILHRQRLVISHGESQGDVLLQMNRRQRRDRMTAVFANPLAIRFRGFDPQLILNWLYPKTSWLFTPWCVAFSMTLALAALIMALVYYPNLLGQLRTAEQFFTPQNVGLFVIALAVTKILHELGHALTCQHFGGECHEMGIMLLAFTPCLYCNVTDSWMFADKRQRMAVAGAGIYVEILLASVCTFLWVASEPGLFNSLCLNVIVICSVGTLLLNGNPLLRYDGYFIVSDLVDLPNLWQRSRTLMQTVMMRLCFGLRRDENLEWADRRWAWLLTYWVLSTTYRLVVIGLILLVVHQALRPYGLQLVAQGVTAMVVAGLFVAPLATVWRTMSDPSTRRYMSTRRTSVTTALITAAVLGVLLIPIPHRIRAPLIMRPLDAERVFVSVAGRVLDAKQPGLVVRRGDVLATLENLELAREVEKLESELEQRQLHLRNLQSLRSTDPFFAQQIPTAREGLADTQNRLERRRQEFERLVLTSPDDGIVIPPPAVISSVQEKRELPSWTGRPMDAHNRGCYLETGTLYCLVGNPQQHEAAVYLSQSDIIFVRRGQRVRLRVDQSGTVLLEGAIERISKVDSASVPPLLANQLTSADPNRSSGRPVTTVYEAVVRLETHQEPLVIGSTGEARVSVDAVPLGQRWLRRLSQAFSRI